MKRGVDYIGVGVGAILVDGDGRLFLARRGPQAKNERGLWEFPGGSVEFGEQLAAALQREMREEYGIEISVGELLDVVDHILPEEGQHWVSPTFICRITSGIPEILEPDKCAEIGWFHSHEIPDNLTQITRINFEHYRHRLGLTSSPGKTNGDQSNSADRSSSDLHGS
jgi:8-oxo-dGTP diphosphatase